MPAVHRMLLCSPWLQLPLEQGPVAKAVPLSSVSGTNPLDDQHWAAAGQQEVQRLAAHMRQHGKAMPLAEARAGGRACTAQCLAAPALLF